ncbi:hypothetical protein HUU40_06660 [candidate division KSB1 bacterium]|nr:hypothetical protein [candidate division KSB1 bacterium]
MPVFKSGSNIAPSWCEMEYFEIVRLNEGAAFAFERAARKEKFFVCEGRCRITQGSRTVTAQPGEVVDFAGEPGPIEVKSLSYHTVLVRVCGHWGEEIGGCGVFTLDNSDHPQNHGDPTDYPRTTDFDNHYHDCDEYWIIYAGRGLAVSEGVFYEVGAGDCVATACGYHHDFPQVFETIKGVYFETTLQGQKRLGHLWDHTHGPGRR